jgi:hypothetical protein
LPILGRPVFGAPARSATTTIRVGTRVIDVNGRAAVFGLAQPDGTHGLIIEVDQRYGVRLDNAIDEATPIHWHGLTPL